MCSRLKCVDVSPPPFSFVGASKKKMRVAKFVEKNGDIRKLRIINWGVVCCPLILRDGQALVEDLS